MSIEEIGIHEAKQSETMKIPNFGSLERKMKKEGIEEGSTPRLGNF
jgi:hypothetical protein